MEYKSENRKCQNCHSDFIIEPDDFGFYEKIKVPPPSWCPRCRYIRRLTYINKRSLYKSNCGNCNKSIISMYAPASSIQGWCMPCYLSDKWDARNYGREYDFSRNFFEQFNELNLAAPHRALDQNERNGEGCEYSNFCYTSKNIYLSFDVGGCENIMYSEEAFKNNKNCLDSLFFRANERGYELIHSRENYNSSFLLKSDQCVESHFLYDCLNCVNCCLSSNLRNKSYVFKNQQLSREKYLEAMRELSLETYSGQKKAKDEFREIYNRAIHRYAQIKNSVDSTGDFIENSKNVHHCYGVVNAENSKYVYVGANTTKDSQDLYGTGKIEECYELTFSGRGGSRVVLSLSCGGGSDNLFYCIDCRGCSNCFGCVGLSKRSYCIFNKQFSKEEYERLVEKIKKHMDEMSYEDKSGRKYSFGEFFPSEFSPFAYNETVAFEEEPIQKEKVLSLGYRWQESEEKTYIPTIKSADLPDSIDDVPDSLLEEIIECPHRGQAERQCTLAYRIIPDELSFYRLMKLPLPRSCPNCRYHDRLMWKNPFSFYRRECMCELSGHEHGEKCHNEFETMYAPDRTEKIFCKDCYQKEIY